tara:strand:+ start:122566 stop:122985 length:420 start_codon:yes stop_codon:yes gene_type:complete
MTIRELAIWRSPRAALFLALGFALMILAVSSIPATRMPKSPSLWRWDKVVHATEYAILGTLVFRAFATRGISLVTTFFAAAVLCCLFGVLDETYQSTVPGRDSSHFDMLADCTGAIFACVASVVLYSRTRNSNVDNSNL